MAISGGRVPALLPGFWRTRLRRPPPNDVEDPVARGATAGGEVGPASDVAFLLYPARFGGWQSIGFFTVWCTVCRCSRKNGKSVLEYRFPYSLQYPLRPALPHVGGKIGNS